MDATSSDKDAVKRQKGECRYMAGWYMAVRGMGYCRRGVVGQSGGHAEGLRLTGVVGS